VVSGSTSGGDLHERLSSLIKCHELTIITKDWQGEPNFSDILRIAAGLEKAAPDCIVAIGGGSVLDAVKAARILYEHPDLSIERLGRPFSVPPCRKSTFVAVPTTIGTGSETSSSAILKNSEGRKVFIVSHEFIADYAFLDPSLVTSLPRRVRLTTIADALAHAVEGYVSIIRQPQAMDYAARAVALIARYWKAAIKNDFCAEAALQLQLAALYAGYAQNHCLVGASHALSHAVAQAGFEHGLANAWYLPAVIETNAEYPDVAGAYGRLAEAAGLPLGLRSLLELARAVRDNITPEAWPTPLSDTALAEAIRDPGGRGNPIPLTVELFRMIEARAQ